MVAERETLHGLTARTADLVAVAVNYLSLHLLLAQEEQPHLRVKVTRVEMEIQALRPTAVAVVVAQMARVLLRLIRLAEREELASLLLLRDLP
jgi:hypothetical protein